MKNRYKYVVVKKYDDPVSKDRVIGHGFIRQGGAMFGPVEKGTRFLFHSKFSEEYF